MYEEIKTLVLNEHKLSPAAHQEKFGVLRKDEKETYTMFSTKLEALMDGYLEHAMSAGSVTCVIC